MIVVEDTPPLVALYCRAGTSWKNVARHATAREVLSHDQPALVDQVWEGTDILMLVVPGEAHSVWAMWEKGSRDLRCWYINLESPLRRTPIGFDTMDHELDIVISPDRSEWRWKDEEAFNELVAGCAFTPQEAWAIRAEGERVIRQLQAGIDPYWVRWETWSPPAGWDFPGLPKNWDMDIPESLALR